MLRFENSFIEILKKKYRERPVVSTTTGKVLTYSVPRLVMSIKKFIDEKLQKLDDELYTIYKHKTRGGYSEDNYYNLFKIDNPNWKPNRDLVDLYCYYAFNQSYEYAVINGLLQDNLSEFRSLKTDRSSIQPEKVALEVESENAELLEYYKRKVELAKNYPNMEISVASLDKHDLEVLKQIQPLRESLGEIHWDVIENRFLVNPNIVRGLKISTPIENVIVGFFILYPLTKNCQNKIEKGEIQKSDEFGLMDICKNFDSATAIYISLVFAVDMFSKGILLMKLKDEMLQVLTRHSNIKSIFVRPATKDGLRNILKNQFTQLENSILYHQHPEYFLNKQQY